MAAKMVAGGTDGFHLRVGSGVMLSGYPVAALADDDAILDHQCRKGPTQALADIVFRQGEHRLDQGLMSQVLFHDGGPVA
jgi:hypothetical protein